MAFIEEQFFSELNLVQSQYQGQGQEWSGRVPHPQHTESRKKFLQGLGLPNSFQMQNELKVGQKILRIERRVGRPGLAFVLPPTYSSLSHLPQSEENRLVDILIGAWNRDAGRYPELLGLADRYSEWGFFVSTVT
ncbi:hypothetical protein BDV06DRAFT_36798 [Aspergillus oleicola]